MMADRNPNGYESHPQAGKGDKDKPVSTSKAQTTQAIQAWLVERISDMLDLEPAEIDIHEPFTSFGLSSRDAVTTSGDLEEWLGRPLSPVLLYEYPTIQAISEFLGSEQGSQTEEFQMPQADISSNEPIAVIGMAGRFPGSENINEFWAMLLAGEDAVGEIPASRWNLNAYYDPTPDTPAKMYTRWGGFLKDIEQFEPQFFGISPREAVHMDPQQRLLLEIAWEALENAGVAPDSLVGTQTGVFVGISNMDYSLLQHGDLEMIDAYTGTGNAFSIAANRLSYVLDLHGPSLSVDTACSSSLISVHLACQSLRRGEADLALSGGVNLILSPEMTIAFSRAHMMSPTGRCRTFDASADGYVRGEGCGMLVLKRLKDATRDGDTILAVIRGSAANQSGRSNGMTAPSALAQEAVIRSALRNAGLVPAQIGYVEAHGTGTVLGDPIEMKALGAVMVERPADDPCLVASVKTNIGHLEAAAGIAGLIKTILVLQHGLIPAHLHLKQVNPYISLADLRLSIPTDPREWPRNGSPRRAGVSSFGFGGANAHIILEEAPAAAPHHPISPAFERPSHLLCLSARDERALQALAGRYADLFANNPSISLADVSYSANTGRAQRALRLALIGQGGGLAQAALAGFAAGQDVPEVRTALVSGVQKPAVAFLFTGQGAQYASMGKTLYETQPTFRLALDRCALILSAYLEKPLLEVMGVVNPIEPELTDRLDNTAYTQPALFAIEYALAQMWLSWGILPDAMIGHSVGEYVAACLAGVFSLEDGLKLIALRGRLMGGLPPDGEMAAIFAPAERVASILAPYLKRVDIAAVNGPENTVISGAREAIEQLIGEIQAAGITTRPLRVSHAFHSPLMDSILDEFEGEAQKLQYHTPQLPIISNLTGEVMPSSFIPGAEYWRRHIRQAVQFEKGIQALDQLGCKIYLEAGPNPTLLGMARRCLPKAQAVWAPSLKQDRDDWQNLLESIASLYLAGVPVDWRGFDRDYPRRRLPLPTYPFQRQYYWIESPVSSSLRTSASLPGLASPPVGQDVSKEAMHPLLARRLLSPLIKDAVFETQISLQTHRFLSDHRIYGAALFPATGYLEIALAGAAQIFGASPHSLENVRLIEAMVVPEERPLAVQIVFSRPDEGSSSFQIYSLPETDGEQSPVWTLHASGNVRPSEPAKELPSNPNFELTGSGEEEIPAPAYYQKLRYHGLEYGQSFQAIQAIWRKDGQTIGQLALPEGIAAQAESYLLHPALLDAGFQLLAAALPGEQQDWRSLYLPVGVEKFEVFAPGAASARCQVVLRQEAPAGIERKPDTLVADLSLMDNQGNPLAKISGLTVKRIGRQALPGGVNYSIDDWLYQAHWQPKPLDNRGAIQNLPGVWLILADRSGLGRAIGSRLAEQKQTCVLVYPGERLERLEDGSWQADPLNLDHFQKIIKEIKGSGVPVRGAAHLWSLDSGVDTTDPAGLKAAQALGSGSALHVVQALVLGDLPAGLRLWLVTRGAQPVRPDSPLAAAQAPLWGLGNVVALEHPELRCARLDLDPAVTDASITAEADLLFAELNGQDGEDQLGYRGGERFVRRLERGSQESSNVAISGGEEILSPDHPMRLEISARGVLDNLYFNPIVREKPGPGQVEIEVRAAGLNFRDVMNALGLYPGDPGPLGGECAGLVSALGEGVPGLHVGQEVIAIAPASFGNFTTTDARLIVGKPRNLSFEQAATIPIAFLTAYYGLNRLAQIRSSDKVLVHAASGGVGLAAIQLAQLAGAEIFALAGSPAKREYLQSLGVRQVMDSRSFDFADQVMTATGGKGVDIILNSLSGDYIPKNLSILAPGGRFLEIGKAGIWTAEQVSAMRPDVAYHPIALDDLSRQDPVLVHGMMHELIDLFETGSLQPVRFTSYPMSQAVDAFRLMAQTKHIGKIVLAIDLPHEEKGPIASQENTNSARISIRSEATYLITGGLGSLGLLISNWLVSQGARSLVLIGKSLPSDQAAWLVDDLRRAGARVEVRAVDVAQAEQIAGVFREIQGDPSLPPVRGVFHLAGLLDDGLLIQQNWERFTRVTDPKILGAYNLHTLTRNMPLDFFICFSSIASLMGSPGQVNYAAANAYLDSLAYYRQQQSLPAQTINWGPWAAIGMAAISQSKAQRRAANGIGAIHPDQGLEALAQLLNSPSPQVAVLNIDWPSLAESLSLGGVPPLLGGLVDASTQAVETTGMKRSEVVIKLEAAPLEERKKILVEFLRERVVKVLGLSPAFVLDTRRPLNEMGLDSLMAVELKNVLDQALGHKLSATLVFEYPTIDAIASYLLSEVLTFADGAVPEPEAQPISDPINQTEHLLDKLETLSDDEAEALLLDKLAAFNKKKS